MVLPADALVKPAFRLLGRSLQYRHNNFDVFKAHSLFGRQVRVDKVKKHVA